MGIIRNLIDRTREVKIMIQIKVIHGGLNCKQYQEMTKKESENNADTSKTRNMLEVK